MRARWLGLLVALCATGCFGGKGVVTIEGGGTHIVRSPGAVTVVKDGRTCTMQTPGGHHGAAGKHGGKAGKQGKDGPHHRPMGGRAAGNPLDTVMFRLCEARSNGDITEAQYTEAVGKLLDTMGKMAHRGPMGMKDRGRGGRRRGRDGAGRGGAGRGGHRGPDGRRRGRGGRRGDGPKKGPPPKPEDGGGT